MTAVDPVTGQDHSQLVELARPFPRDLVETKDKADYVAHPIVNQRLLSVVGPFDFELVREIRGDVAAVEADPSARSARGKAGTPPLANVVTGGVWRLTAEIDGRRVRVEEVGDCDPHNNTTDGARLKEAASDALKRCAMRLGLGLHLWSKGHYFLDQQLNAQFAAAAPQETAAPQESEPRRGEHAQDAGGDSTDADPAKALDPSLGPVADGTPPGFDHLQKPALILAWLRGQPEIKAQVEADARDQKIDLEKAALDDLRRLVKVALRT